LKDLDFRILIVYTGGIWVIRNGVNSFPEQESPDLPHFKIYFLGVFRNIFLNLKNIFALKFETLFLSSGGLHIIELRNENFAHFPKG